MSSPWFLPARSEDLTCSAKILAFHLDLKLQQAQELLSRLYGYADLHELQKVMKTDSPPGPYDDVDGCEPHRYHRREKHILDIMLSVGPTRRGEPLYTFFGSATRGEGNSLIGETQLTKPGLGVAELDLFYSPPHQRRLAKIVSMARDLDDPEHKLNPAFSYGALARCVETGKTLIRLTTLGSAVQLALNVEMSEESKDDLIQAHPNCPWLQLEALRNEIEHLELTYDDSCEIADVHPLFSSLAPLSTDVVDLFEQIAGRDTDNLAHPDSVCGRSYDCRGYSDGLYLAGYVAFNAEDYERASDYLDRYWRFSAHDSHFDAREMIAIANMYMNKPIPLGVIFTGLNSDNERYLAEVADGIRRDILVFARELFPDEGVLLPFVCAGISDSDFRLAAWVFAELACMYPPFLATFPEAYSQTSFTRGEAIYAHMKPFFDARPDIAQKIARLCQSDSFREKARKRDGAGARALAMRAFFGA